MIVDLRTLSRKQWQALEPEQRQELIYQSLREFYFTLDICIEYMKLIAEKEATELHLRQRFERITKDLDDLRAGMKDREED